MPTCSRRAHCEMRQVPGGCRRQLSQAMQTLVGTKGLSLMLVVTGLRGKAVSKLAFQSDPNALLRGVPRALTGFTLISSLWLSMMIAGLWFGYWIRQEGLQLTHIALLSLP